ncbi:MAG: hypothetical protein MK180_16330 [Rhodobacteraceae bacterium]|nr:hypothetical protein [Paracoccaceae bacterium]
MKRRNIILGAVLVLVAVLALPLKNFYASSRHNPSLFTELSFGPHEVQVIGEGATNLAEQLQKYADANDEEFVVFGPNEVNMAKTLLVVLSTFDRISELP